MRVVILVNLLAAASADDPSPLAQMQAKVDDRLGEIDSSWGGSIMYMMERRQLVEGKRKLQTVESIVRTMESIPEKLVDDVNYGLGGALEAFP